MRIGEIRQQIEVADGIHVPRVIELSGGEVVVTALELGDVNVRVGVAFTTQAGAEGSRRLP